ncbi:MAG TPA: PaaI family thioesterase [Rhizobiaceae bacterium]|nr:PaaI family thioesterase [Rhizobiaceae bacterium]
MSARIIPDEIEAGVIPLARMHDTAGIDLFREMLAGKLPPAHIAKLLNFAPSDVDDGMVRVRGQPLLEHYNPAGTVHGGWMATLLDSALGCCVMTKLPAGTGYTTIEFKVNLIRPLSAHSGEVICEARVVHLGRTTAVSEGTIKTADGKLIATGTETCAIFPLPPLK